MKKRVFVIVMDSVGIGSEPDADRFYNAGHNDVGSNTWVHIAEKNHGLSVPALEGLGLGDLAPIQGVKKVKHPHSYVQTLRERSNGKDTLTGHWEMMGILTENPLVTFTDTGFPKELMDELSKRTGRKLIGNYSQSGTVILEELGEEQTRDGSLIVYTSADSVLQIAANKSCVPLEELYRDCEIAREITMKKEWRVGRVIARPFVGTDKTNFKRTSERRDYALAPEGRTSLDDLLDNAKEVIAIGKIHDIFAGRGMNESMHIDSNHDGMMKTLDVVKNRDFEGLCFVNLADFDVLYGHRRNPKGYAECLEEFDRDLALILEAMRDDDLLMITADHGNDPTWYGTDHTRERVPLISYSPSYQNGRMIEEKDTFGCIGKTILENFSIKPSENQIGDVIPELLTD
ncbi:MAG: phosphopentomutase [Candidatus Enterosoma sp.]|nr:phosphopentomutase [Bacilli bacterium]MDD7093566.1 phosphopentomutase [bacterium]MDD7707121.1 phosphopentomutase [bacterium]MDY3210593.1 phosphopentomutase [Candidatus Enterosoma sp.]MDY3264841.1 phosphopentomutase [Candidatus Enterosoma sp.]